MRKSQFEVPIRGDYFASTSITTTRNAFILSSVVLRQDELSERNPRRRRNLSVNFASMDSITSMSGKSRLDSRDSKNRLAQEAGRMSLEGRQA